MTLAVKNHKTNSLETPAMKSTQTAFSSERTADLEQKRSSLMKMKKLPWFFL